MKSDSYKSKKFLFPILSLVLISIILIASTSLYITSSLSKAHMNKQIQDIKKEYTQNNKNEVQKEVNFLNDTIKFRISKIESKLKKTLAERVKIALDITTYTYNIYKDKLNKEEIKTKISEALAAIKFNDNNNYYFMYDNKSKVIFGHPLKEFMGRDMTDFKDTRGQSLMKLDADSLIKDKIGFNKIYFNKPDKPNKEFPKITCITKFEPLDLVIGTGEYLDVIEAQTKKYILERFSKFQNKDTAFFIIDLHSINGGVDFGTVLLSLNTPKFVGRKMSDDKKDIKGNFYLKNLLEVVRENGSGFTQYWYKKAFTEKHLQKMTYIHLQKDWNWIIGSGFYYVDLDEQISLMEEEIIAHTNNTMNTTIIWVFSLSLIAVLIAVFVSFRIDKTIKKYTDAIINYEQDKREQENLLIEQSKMAAMGEMLGNIAHQWRQPLSVIATSATGIKLKKELNILDENEIEETMTNINASTQYLSQTIDDFRTFFDPHTSKLKEFSVPKMINKAFKLLEAQFKSKDIVIIKNIEDNNLMSLENEIIQVLINILNNTRDTFDIREKEVKLIFISSYKKDNSLFIEILDNAGGIDNKIIDRIFEPYFTTKHQFNGTGIGLYMSRNIVSNHLNGNLSVVNEEYIHAEVEYKGAKFIIKIDI